MSWMEAASQAVVSGVGAHRHRIDVAGVALDRRRCLFLHQAVQFEPVGASAVTGAALGHSHQKTLSEPTGFA